MNEIIETMVAAFLESMCKNDAGAQIAMRDALRAAKAEGWELCRLPGKFGTPIGNRHEIRGYYACLYGIERLELDQAGGQRD